MYAILDIETTGGQFNKEGITEIAIYKFDGNEIVDQFISLVNPEIEIQPFVVKLTGINNAMLRSAPKFFEIAKRIIEITQNCIIVAHNASFDYRILQTEFNRLGFDFQAKTLCTVELAKRFIPEMPSYSLGKLVRSLGIPIADRHRASGDAIATVKLFKILLEKDTEKIIISQFVKFETQKQIAPKWLDLIAEAPTETGIYYIYNKKAKLVYIGRSKNIKKHLNSYFTKNTTQSKRIQKDFFTVKYEETGSELIAILKEKAIFSEKKPQHNHKLQYKKSQFGLYITKKEQYLYLNIEKKQPQKTAELTFLTEQEAKNILKTGFSNCLLCPKLTNLAINVEICSQNENLKCKNDNCFENLDPDLYNKKAIQFIETNNFKNKSLVLIDKGRKIDEHSAILIENGEYKGYAFFNLNYQIINPEVLKKIIIPMESTPEINQIIQSYARKSKTIKTIFF